MLSCGLSPSLLKYPPRLLPRFSKKLVPLRLLRIPALPKRTSSLLKNYSHTAQSDQLESIIISPMLQFNIFIHLPQLDLSFPANRIFYPLIELDRLLHVLS